MAALERQRRRSRVAGHAGALVTGGRWLARRIPGARLELFADAHAFLFSERARFARVVDEFLDRG